MYYLHCTNIPLSIKVGVNLAMNSKTIFPLKKVTVHITETCFISFIILICRKVIHTKFAVVNPATCRT